MKRDSGAEMTTLEIWKGPDAELRVGGLRLVACRREVDTIDGGVTLCVWNDLGGRASRELLRLDLFRNRPHYHAPADRQKETRIDAGSDGSLAWGVEALTSRARALLAEGGFEAIAAELDAEALAGAGPELRALLDGLGEPSERSTFEVPTAMLERGGRG